MDYYFHDICMIGSLEVKLCHISSMIHTGFIFFFLGGGGGGRGEGGMFFPHKNIPMNSLHTAPDFFQIVMQYLCMYVHPPSPLPLLTKLTDSYNPKQTYQKNDIEPSMNSNSPKTFVTINLI